MSQPKVASNYLIFQGDLLFRYEGEAEKFVAPAGEPVEQEVAVGEISGHRHIVSNDQATWIPNPFGDKLGELHVRTAAEVRHVSSKPLAAGEKLHEVAILPAGRWDVVKQQRYDRVAAFKERERNASRPVLD